jgi:hypothetical protein
MFYPGPTTPYNRLASRTLNALGAKLAIKVPNSPQSQKISAPVSRSESTQTILGLALDPETLFQVGSRLVRRYENPEKPSPYSGSLSSKTDKIKVIQYYKDSETSIVSFSSLKLTTNNLKYEVAYLGRLPESAAPRERTRESEKRVEQAISHLKSQIQVLSLNLKWTIHKDEIGGPDVQFAMNEGLVTAIIDRNSGQGSNRNIEIPIFGSAGLNDRNNMYLLEQQLEWSLAAVEFIGTKAEDYRALLASASTVEEFKIAVQKLLSQISTDEAYAQVRLRQLSQLEHRSRRQN